MAGRKVEQLPAASTLTGAELIYVVQSGSDRQANVGAIGGAAADAAIAEHVAATDPHSDRAYTDSKLTNTGFIVSSPTFDSVPGIESTGVNAQAQALANQIAWVVAHMSGTSGMGLLLELEEPGGLSPGPYPLDTNWSTAGPTMVFLDGSQILSSYYSMTATELTLIGVTASNYERIIVRGSPA